MIFDTFAEFAELASVARVLGYTMATFGSYHSGALWATDSEDRLTKMTHFDRVTENGRWTLYMPVIHTPFHWMASTEHRGNRQFLPIEGVADYYHNWCKGRYK